MGDALQAGGGLADVGERNGRCGGHGLSFGKREAGSGKREAGDGRRAMGDSRRAAGDTRRAAGGG
ncbi:hypothetical protein ACE1SV_05790 [Streptomyces sp. E-15]